MFARWQMPAWGRTAQKLVVMFLAVVKSPGSKKVPDGLVRVQCGLPNGSVAAKYIPPTHVIIHCPCLARCARLHFAQPSQPEHQKRLSSWLKTDRKSTRLNS